MFRRQFYFETKTQIRQRELLEQFDFVCHCEACINPEKFLINYKDEEEKEEEEKGDSHDGDNLIAEFIKNRQFIIDKISEYPSYELINAMHKNRKILQRLAADVDDLKP